MSRHHRDPRAAVRAGEVRRTDSSLLARRLVLRPVRLLARRAAVESLPARAAHIGRHGQGPGAAGAGAPPRALHLVRLLRPHHLLRTHNTAVTPLDNATSVQRTRAREGCATYACMPGPFPAGLLT